MSRKHKILLLLSVVIILVAVLPSHLSAQGIPKINLSVDQSDSPQDFSTTMKILIGMTVLALVPTVLVMVTSFVRIIVVIMMTRQAMGTPQMPPSQVLMGMALILTIFVMAPVFNKVYSEAVKPYVNGEMNQDEAYKTGIQPIRTRIIKC